MMLLQNNFHFRNHQEDLHLVSLTILLTLFFYFFVIPNEGFASVFFAITSSISTSGIAVYSSDLDLSLFFIIVNNCWRFFDIYFIGF